MLLSHLGLVGFFANVASVGLLAVLIAAVVWRIRVEERVLWDVPGYPAYARHRARLLPGVW
jgi:protein-S-isoprenylcysteine O-methyltransferase Ste14